jgi:hypothetical protein
MVDASIAHKVVGYFSHSPEGGVFCDGEACIVAGTETLMYLYIQEMIISDENKKKAKSMVVKKTRFGEILAGLTRGGVYAFDKESYLRFFSFAKKYELDNFPEPEDFFSKQPPTGLCFITIQLTEE